MCDKVGVLLGTAQRQNTHSDPNRLVKASNRIGLESEMFIIPSALPLPEDCFAAQAMMRKRGDKLKGRQKV